MSAAPMLFGEPDTKRCSKCGEVKATVEFGRRAEKRGGLRSHCGACVAEYNRKRRSDPAVREARRAYDRKRRSDPAVREAERTYNRKRRSDPAYREAERKYNRKRRTAPSPAYMKAQRERARARWRRLTHGVTYSDYVAMFTAQGGACVLCGEPMRLRLDGEGPPLKFDAVVDHDHVTGAVRGILHSNCNRAIGLFGDNEARCEAAARYLRDAAARGAK